MRVCKACGIEKSLEDFPLTRGKNRPKYRKRTCWECERAQRRANYNDPETGNKTAILKHRYGITLAERDAMLIVQDGCAICHTWEPGGRDWCVDHDHDCCPGKRSCGKCVRGVLCFSCNVGLGAFHDSPQLMARAAEFINVSRRLPA